ncbi:MAG: cell division protein ZapA [Deltaproteobacteria bacterium]|nr:cell division protein ZapA [Deltaproteobacteria bacterium]
MAAKKSVSVRILDQDFHITTDASPERVAKISDFLNKNLQDAVLKSKSGSQLHAAIIAALNITEKYFDAIEKQAELKTRVVEKSRKILGLLDNAGNTP